MQKHSRLIHNIYSLFIYLFETNFLNMLCFAIYLKCKRACGPAKYCFLTIIIHPQRGNSRPPSLN